MHPTFFFAIRLFLDAILSTTNRTGSPLCLALVDERKAFDSVPPWLVTLALERMGAPAGWVKMISFLLSPSSLSFLTVHGPSPDFLRHRGVPQGGVLSPLFFVIAFDLLLQRLRAIDIGFSLEFNSLRASSSLSSNSSFLCFADDTVLLASTPDHLVSLLEEVVRFGEWTGIELNPKKTVLSASDAVLVAAVDAAVRDSDVLGDMTFKVVDPKTPFKYLGVLRCVAGASNFVFERDRLLKFTRLAALTATKRWIPDVVAPNFCNELVGGTLQYSFLSPPPPPRTTLTSLPKPSTTACAPPFVWQRHLTSPFLLQR